MKEIDMRTSRSSAYSILHEKCPRCHQGDMYTYGMYNLKKFQEMPKSCKKCGQPFFLEPMFYEGAQYVSYAIQVALFVSWFVAFNVLFDDFDISGLIACIMVSSIILIPFNWRISRVFLIHFFVRFDKYKSNQDKQSFM